MAKYTLVCGLEIHTQLKTKSKMFCGCQNDPFTAPQPNIYTCPTCLGLPGGLPVANAKAIEWTIKLGLFFNCKINLFSKFDRKNYFYPDLAKGYQISQYDLPFCYDGVVETSAGPVRINRIHLEEDTAKLLHSHIGEEKVTLIDFNRSGVPLVEIVSEPDIKSSAQAIEYGKKIRQALRYLGFSEADMEKGGMRLEANISLQTAKQAQAKKLPSYKVEVKNINSFNFMGQAIDYEIARQTKLLDAGEKIKQQTFGFNSQTGKTFVQRDKENAIDYRYFPDPDLPSLQFTKKQIDTWRKELPPNQQTILSDWQNKYQLSEKYASKFITTQEKISWSQKLWQLAKKEGCQIEQLANFLVNKKIRWQFGDPIVEVLDKFKAQTSTVTIDQEKLEKIITDILQSHSQEVARFQQGEKKLQGFFLGQIMRQLKEKIDPQLLIQTFQKMINR